MNRILKSTLTAGDDPGGGFILILHSIQIETPESISPPNKIKHSLSSIHYSAVCSMGSDKSSYLVLLSLLLLTVQSTSHEEPGEWSCEPDLEARVIAEFNPAIVTIDGRGEDWKYVDGFEFSLLPALDPDQENEYKSGKMSFKVTLFDALIESFNPGLIHIVCSWI